MCQTVIVGNREIDTLKELFNTFPEVTFYFKPHTCAITANYCLCPIDLKKSFTKAKIKYDLDEALGSYTIKEVKK